MQASTRLPTLSPSSHHARSVSSPNFSLDETSFRPGSIASAGQSRRESLPAHSNLPSIRSLKSKFQSLSNGSDAHRHGIPRVIREGAAESVDGGVAASPAAPPKGGIFSGFGRNLKRRASFGKASSKQFQLSKGAIPPTPQPLPVFSSPAQTISDRAPSPVPLFPLPPSSPTPSKKALPPIHIAGSTGRVSGDFVRATSDPPLATLRADYRPLSIIKRESSYASLGAGQSTDVACPTREPGSPQVPPKTGFEPSLRAGTPLGLRKPSPRIGVESSLKNDMAYRRLSIQNQPSPQQDFQSSFGDDASRAAAQHSTSSLAASPDLLEGKLPVDIVQPLEHASNDNLLAEQPPPSFRPSSETSDFEIDSGEPPRLPHLADHVSLSDVFREVESVSTRDTNLNTNGPLEGDRVLLQPALKRSRSAYESVKAAGEQMREVESGSPVLVRTGDRVAAPHGSPDRHQTSPNLDLGGRRAKRDTGLYGVEKIGRAHV